jgi:hypothetical protein
MGSVCEKVSGRGGDLNSGCYLVASEGQQGTLTMHWSESPVKGALASFHPRKPVPKHKFTTNHGKVELMQQANLGVHKTRYLEGWCQFVKAAKKHDGALFVLTDVVVLYIHTGKDAVVSVRGHSLTELAQASAVAAFPKGYTSLKGVSKLPKTQFCNRGAQDGASIAV